MSYQPKCLLGKEKLDFVLKHLQATQSVDGDVIEVGCYQGGTLFFMNEMTPARKRVVGYDTFQGLPEPLALDLTGPDKHSRGDFADTNFNEVMRHFSPLGVEIVQAHFPVGVSQRPISFAHVDVDFFKSTWDSLLYLRDNLVPGGRIVCDDYGWPKTPGVKKAVDQALISKLFNFIEAAKNQIVLGL